MTIKLKEHGIKLNEHDIYRVVDEAIREYLKGEPAEDVETLIGIENSHRLKKPMAQVYRERIAEMEESSKLHVEALQREIAKLTRANTTLSECNADLRTAVNNIRAALSDLDD